jgi:carbon monoxide dehydrogenase subunit G
MKVAGEAVLHAPVEQVWTALLDPTVLVRTIPGCERLDATGENAYAMTVTAGVAAIRGTYSGTCRLTDLAPHDSLVLKASGAGAPGTIAADVKVSFADSGDGSTLLRYDADAVVGGMIGGVGQRMLTSVTRRMAGEFFGNVEQVLNGAEPAPGVAADAGTTEQAAAAAGQSFVAPSRAASAPVGDDFVKGVVVGAGLVLVGVITGAVAARRRS